jgi:DNA mismatch repair protein MutS
MALVEEYLRLTKQYKQEYGEKTILLMQVGSFLEMYGPDTEIYNVSKICDLSVSTTSTRIMAGFPDSTIDKYVHKIQAAGYTIMLHLQHKTNPTIRELHSIISPGTYINPEMEVQKNTNNMACIWINYIPSTIIHKYTRIEIGIAVIDTYTGNTTVSEYLENYNNIQDICVFNKLETNISRYNPIECIIITNLSSNDINDIQKYIGLSSLKVHMFDLTNSSVVNCQKQTYQQEICNKFYNKVSLEYCMPVANQTLCYLLNFIYIHNPSLVSNIKYPTYVNTSNTLILETHSLKQLNIIETGATGKYSSVLKVLNTCVTPMGVRAFENDLLNPINNVDILTNKYNQIETFINYLPLIVDKEDNFKKCLSGMYDISKFIRLLHLHNNNTPRISPKQLMLMYNTVYHSNTLLSIVYPYINNNLDLMGSICNMEQIQNNILELLQLFESVFNIESCLSIQECKDFTINIFKTGIDAELDKCTESIKDTLSQIEFIRKYLIECMKRDSKFSNTSTSNSSSTTELIKLEYNNNDMPKLCCTTTRFNILKAHLPNKNTKIILPNSSTITLPSSDVIPIKTGSKSSTIQISNIHLDELCSTFQQLKQQLQSKMNIVYNTFTNNLVNYITQLNQIEEFVVHFDLLYSKAITAKLRNYCKPNIIARNKSFIETTYLRHALIELISENEEYISNDLTIGNNITDGILLYGFNMSGKTSLIRSVGVAVIMAQAGLYVPATSFNFYPYQYLFTRILGNDNLFQGLSTFATEMNELKTILKLCNENSLILGDEICSGTETISACSIFMSTLLQLVHKKSTYMFASHLHEILTFDEIRSINTLSIKHLEVQYDYISGHLVYNRKIKEGPGSNIYGLEVCKSLSMPDDFIHTAENIKNKYFNNLGSNTDGILGLSTSAYNSKKIINICEKCKRNKGTEIHHVKYQKTANDLGYIKNETHNSIFHKNALHNLMSVCFECHKDIHV